MIIAWDEPKRMANIAKHGLDFAEVGPSFLRDAVVRPAKFGRYRVFGRLDGRAVALVFARLGTEGLSYEIRWVPLDADFGFAQAPRGLATRFPVWSTGKRVADQPSTGECSGKDESMTQDRPDADDDLAVVSDNPEWTAEDFEAAIPFRDVFPEFAAQIERGGPDTVQVSIDRDLVDRFKSEGADWELRLNSRLREAIRSTP